MSTKRGRNEDLDVAAAFRKFRKDGAKTERAQCTHCGYERSWKTDLLRAHLSSCEKYKASLFAKDSTKLQLKQSQITVPALGPIAHKALRLKYAMAVYMGGLPFNHYHQEYMRAAIKATHPGLTLPDRKDLAGVLLIDCYKTIQGSVLPHISTSASLNLVTDESTNIRKQRVQNLCASVPSFGAFYIKSEVLSKQTVSAKWTADWLINEASKLTNNDLSRLNSWATDTCNTIRSAWKEAAKDPRLAHVFFVPCDSHGLQLLVKDIIQEVVYFQQTASEAQSIVTAFQASPKQLGALRECMIETNGKATAFVLSCITRWGTQLAMVKSVNKKQAALQKFFLNRTTALEDANEKDSAIRKLDTLVWDKDFWQRLQFLCRSLAPIDNAIKMSESDRATIGDVIPRWRNIRNHLIELTKSPEALENTDIACIINRTFEPRYKTQIEDLHVIAYLLNPRYAGDVDLPYYTEPQWRNILHCFFVKQRVNHVAAMEQFNEFWRKEGRFNRDLPVWQYTERKEVFWEYIQASCPELGPLALRVARTPANSVASERSFSILKLLMNKFRAQLTPQHVDMLQYIYINERVLNRILRQNATPEELMEVEDKAAEVGEGYTENPAL